MLHLISENLIISEHHGNVELWDTKGMTNEIGHTVEALLYLAEESEQIK